MRFMKFKRRGIGFLIAVVLSAGTGLSLFSQAELLSDSKLLAQNAAIKELSGDDPFVLRQNSWKGIIEPGQAELIQIQLFNRNDYRFWFAVPDRDAEVSVHLYDGKGNTRSGILGVVLPSVEARIFKGSVRCSQCGSSHNCVAIGDRTVVSEFSYNYYIPNGKCCYEEDERYCVLVKWNDFCAEPDKYIDDAFRKRSDPIADKVKVYGTA